MKDKLLYLSFNSVKEIGVYKKINFQEKAMKKFNDKVYRTYVEKNYFYINRVKLTKYSEGKGKILKIIRKLEVLFILKKINNYIEKKYITVIYIRYYRTDLLFLYFLKTIKTKYKIKVILEIPTYPYDNEVKSMDIGLLIDKIYRKKIYKYVDKIVTYSEDKVIWGIPCINISNGIDLEEVKMIKKKQHEGINFISVSNCSFWHGIDRFIYSLLQYRKNGGKEIKFHIVGEGTETPKLKKIVKDNIELQDIVIFHSFKSGEELDEIYNNSDIGLGGLAAFKQGLTKGSALKNREYCAKGIPFIVGYEDNSFTKDLPFYYQVSNDESLLDIEKIIEWYKNLKVTPEEIRKYAEDNLTWDKQMKKVIDNI